MPIQQLPIKILKWLLQISLIHEPSFVFFSKFSGWARLTDRRDTTGGFSTRGMMNLSLIISFSLLPLLFFFTIFAICVILLVLTVTAITMVIYPKIGTRNEALSDLKTSLFSLDTFSCIYFLTGSVEVAASYMAGEGGSRTSQKFRCALLYIRNGTEPKQAVLDAFSGSKIYHEWIKSVIHGSLTNTSDILEAWKTHAMNSLSKSEDAISFVILVSTLLPVITTMMFLIFGLGSSPSIFMLILIQVAEFIGVYLWLKDLVFTIE